MNRPHIVARVAPRAYQVIRTSDGARLGPFSLREAIRCRKANDGFRAALAPLASLAVARDAGASLGVA